jgi:hypothetical protein
MFLSLQSLIDYLYRYPKANRIKYARFGGYNNYRKMIGGQSLMEKASLDLPPVYSSCDGWPLYFLTGERYLYQTLFCISSLSRVSGESFHITLVDDGSFNKNLRMRIARQLPGAVIIDESQVTVSLDRLLPVKDFPVLRAKRNVYPHIKKLIDIHTLPGDWKLVLDSDMLFWSAPSELISWLKHPRTPLYMQDCANSYGYSKALMETLAGSPITDLINVGVIGLNSRDIEWAAVESWVTALERHEKTSYYLEQALTAMLIGRRQAVCLSEERYKVMPSSAEVDQKIGVLHHYVDLSKRDYFQKAWKMI